MRLGLNLGYQTAWSSPATDLAMAQEAERLGYTVVWAAEAYGSDSPSTLAWLAGADLDDRPGRRGHADPGPHPGRDRDDRDHDRQPVRRPVPARARRLRPAGLRGLARRAVRQAAGPHPGVRRHRQAGAVGRKPVEYAGEHYTLPLPDGPGKALRLGFHPPREHIPIYLAAVGPKNLELAGEIADGWLAVFYSPEFAAEQHASLARRPGQGGPAGRGLRRGAQRAGRGRRRRGGGGRARPLVRRALRRRHGQPQAELLQRPGGPDGLRATRRRRCRTSTSTSASGTRRPPYPWSSSTAPRCSAQGADRGPAQGVRRVGRRPRCR